MIYRPPPDPVPPKPLPGAKPYYQPAWRGWFILTDCGPVPCAPPS